jgi:hypothetical protein
MLSDFDKKKAIDIITHASSKALSKLLNWPITYTMSAQYTSLNSRHASCENAMHLSTATPVGPFYLSCFHTFFHFHFFQFLKGMFLLKDEILIVLMQVSTHFPIINFPCWVTSLICSPRLFLGLRGRGRDLRFSPPSSVVSSAATWWAGFWNSGHPSFFHEFQCSSRYKSRNDPSRYIQIMQVMAKFLLYSQSHSSKECIYLTIRQGCFTFIFIQKQSIIFYL